MLHQNSIRIVRFSSHFQIDRILSYSMKNSLELEVASKIKKANSLHQQQKFDQAIDAYGSALLAFHQNRTYNEIISPHFESSILSLKSLPYLALMRYAETEECLNQSLRLSPHNPIALIRRSKLYIELGKLEEAIEDLDNAHLYDPQNKNLHELMSEIDKKINNLQSIEDIKRLSANLSSIKNSEQNQDQFEEEEILSFSNLKKIDKCSDRGEGRKNSRKKVSLFLEFKEDDVNVYGDNVSQQDDDGNSLCKQKRYANEDFDNMPITIVERIKGKGKKCKSIIKAANTNFQQSIVDLVEKQYSVHSGFDVSSVKSIDGKMIQKTSSIRFIQKPEEINNSQCGLSENRLTPVCKNSKAKERKSILRSSKLCEVEVPVMPLKARTSSFLNLKDIEGTVKCSSRFKMDENDESQTVLQKEVSSNFAKDAESDEQSDREHNIYGRAKCRTSKILHCLQNLSSHSGCKNSATVGAKKQSILKKQPSVRGSVESSKEKKKSVCFVKSELFGE